MQASGVTMDNQVAYLLRNATKHSIRQWLNDKCALRCWCSDDAAQQLQLSCTDRNCLVSERTSLLEDIRGVAAGSNDAVHTVTALFQRLEVNTTIT
jgi:hypothetical protein